MSDTHNHQEYPLNAKVWFRESTHEWVLELYGEINGGDLVSRHSCPAFLKPEEVPGLPHLYSKGNASPSSFELPDIGSTWEHTNGNRYVVLHIANAHTQDPIRYPVTVVYQGAVNGLVWTRRADDWHRSMTKVSELKTESPSQGAVNLGARALAGELAKAVATDDADPEGHDMSAGLFGPAVSQWLRKTAADYLSPVRRPRDEASHRLIGILVGVLRSHTHCGDAFPDNGWPEVCNALAEYEKWKRGGDPKGPTNETAPTANNLDPLLPWRSTPEGLVAYVLQDDLHNRLTPRVVDIAYSAFMQGAQGKNKDDGGPCDWFNDTKPMVTKQIEKIRRDLEEAVKASNSGKTAVASSIEAGEGGGEIVRLKGWHHINQHFEDEVLDYDGGPVKSIGTAYINSSFNLVGPAATTLAFMTLIEKVQPGSVKNWFRWAGYEGDLDVSKDSRNTGSPSTSDVTKINFLGYASEDGRWVKFEDYQFVAEKATFSIPLYSVPLSKDETLAVVWQEAYRLGVLDEQTSQDNIGICGFGAKVEPARQNPYLNPTVSNV